jgi:hypothetical protein
VLVGEDYSFGFLDVEETGRVAGGFLPFHNGRMAVIGGLAIEGMVEAGFGVDFAIVDVDSGEEKFLRVVAPE